MAIQNHGVNVLLQPIFIPDEYEVVPVSPFSTTEKATYTVSLRIPRASVKDADRDTTFTQLVDAIKGAAQGVMEDEFDTAKDVELFTDFLDIDTNVIKGKENDFYSDEDTFYVCRCRIYVKVS